MTASALDVKIQGIVKILSSKDVTKNGKSCNCIATDIKVQSPIHVTYDEAVKLTHLINDISPVHMGLFDLSVNEATAFHWPPENDYPTVQEHDPIWNISSKSLAPDPVGWTSRDLQTFLDKHKNVFTKNQIVTGGSYNHLIGH